MVVVKYRSVPGGVRHEIRLISSKPPVVKYIFVPESVHYRLGFSVMLKQYIEP